MSKLTVQRWCLSALSLLLLMALSNPARGQLAERDVAKLIDEYMSTKTADDRRSTIRAQLRQEDPLLMQRSMKKYLKDKDCRKLALDLAADLRVPGLTSDVLKLEKELEQESLEYLFRVQEGKTPGDLLARWTKAEPESQTYRWLSERFARNCVPLTLLPTFRDKLDDAARAEASLAILRFQLADPGAESDAIRNGWDDRIKKLTKEGQVFPIAVKPLFAMPWNMDVLTPLRTNHVLPGSKHLYLTEFPDDWTKRSFSIKLAVLPNDATRIEVAFVTENQQQTATFSYTPDKWYIKFTSGEGAEKAVKRTEWANLELKITNEGSEKDWNRRRCSLSVNGEELQVPGIYYTLNAALRKLTVSTQNSDHAIIIGGGEWSYVGK